MPITYYTARPAFINGQRRGRGEPVDVTGYRAGAIQTLIDRGVIFPSNTASKIEDSDALMSEDISSIKVITETAYGELDPPDEDVLYIVVDDPED